MSTGLPRDSNRQQDNPAGKHVKKSHKKLVWILSLGVLAMFGFCYMMIPFYNFICKQEGINGKSASSPAVLDPRMQIDYSRSIKVNFTTILHHGLAFEFTPLTPSITIHPGEHKLIYFYAENRTGQAITVQAVPSITPADAARYLKKTECFCFTQQYFFAGEKAKMPVYFFVEPEVGKNIQEITLSYTLFDATAFKNNQERFTKGRIDL